ncbi:hypothetical protein D3C72_2185150 [compost metagenome]
MIGRAENDGFLGSDGGKVQDRIGSGEHEYRSLVGAAMAQVAYQGGLGYGIEALFDHVDNERVGIRLQRDQ